jgi:hypothetical protein
VRDRSKNFPNELLQAYAETHYTVHTDEKFTLKIGELSSSLLHLFHQTNALCAAFVTAYNPFSESLPEYKNKELQAQLEADLKKRSLNFIDGIGQHPSGDWPGEPSVLVLDLDLAAATVLAKHYQQNAFVWCGRDGVPQLVAA